MNRLIIIAVTIVSIFAGDRVAAQEAIGTVSRILGEANATRGGDTRALSINTSVILNETVSTGTAGRLEVTFKDNTRVTLGENAKLTLDQYAFNPTSGRRKIRFRVVVSSSNEYRLVGISSVCNAASGCENFLLCVCNAANEIIRWGTIEIINGKAIERIKPRVKGARSDTPIAFRIQLVPNASRTREIQR
ncbi:MAG: hypothetical protein WBL77_01685 [Pseudolabrys sp.]